MVSAPIFLGADMVRKLKRKIEKKAKTETKIKTVTETKELEEIFLSLGVTLVNCGCSDRPDGGFRGGTINTVCGASMSGKTILLLTAMAEAANDPIFDGFELIYDDGEEASNFNIKKLFGEKTAKRLRAPLEESDGTPINSNTIDDFGASVINLCKNDTKFIYILDSLDSLSSSEEIEREYANAIKIAKAQGNRELAKDLKDGYHTEKSKKIGMILRTINGKIKNTDSILIIVQQLRANIGRKFAFEPKEITSGGNAPFFYSTIQLKLFNSSKITVSSTDNTEIGHKTRIDITKNKTTGKRRSSIVSIYDSLGIDDITACLDFLIEKKFVKNAIDKKGKIKKLTFIIPKFNIEGSKANIISQIEEKDLYYELNKFTGECWNEYEKSIELSHRARRYK